MTDGPRDATFDRARYRRILRFASWQLAIAWWFEILLPQIGLAGLAARSRDRRMRRFAVRFRGLAVELGGLMIKLGQFLSSRLDVLPPELTKELEDLQDEVPAVPFDRIRALAEAELGLPLTQVFAAIDEVPVAAASLGQAYRARLSPDDAREAGFADVVVKVQRPGIAGIVAVDLAALRRVGRWMARVRLVSDRTDMPTLVEEFASVSLEEIDYLHEASNAERFAADFRDDARVRAPRIAWERTSRQVLTLEDVTAIKITDHDALRAAGIDPAQVATAFADVMFDQLFLHGFFHADPHPGNLFVTPGPRDAKGRAASFALTFVDFGMMGEVPDRLSGALRALIIAAASRDGHAMVAAMHDAGVLLPSADSVELEKVMEQVFARFGGMGFAQLREVDPREFRDFALEFSDLMLTLPFQLPENFLLIIRAVSLTSGVCSALNPAYNVWDSVEPYAGQLIRDQGRDIVGDVAREVGDVARIAYRLPKRVDAALSRIEDGSLAVTMPKLEKTLDRAERSIRRLISALVFAALLIAGARLHADNAGMGTFLMIGSAVPLLHTVFAGRRGR
ncbi:ABC1 kinase family protein [Demequina lignilytica]|uniref:AarF/UbiB family protein n=1 Tax=Demequina lignilytica TaxID=3051663 RepID=A0AB35MIK7_9MICO|nr:AarF/UbiB family protein [Demequina sp. SYSU T0a273]MDN4483490.1 AarF/UbiB family protein [Demequina sp. SYSU T0a273]